MEQYQIIRKPSKPTLMTLKFTKEAGRQNMTLKTTLVLTIDYQIHNSLAKNELLLNFPSHSPGIHSLIKNEFGIKLTRIIHLKAKRIR